MLTRGEGSGCRSVKDRLSSWLLFLLDFCLVGLLRIKAPSTECVGEDGAVLVSIILGITMASNSLTQVSEGRVRSLHARMK